MSTATMPAVVKCHECQKQHDPDALSECTKCGAGFCASCRRCFCDDINDVIEDLHRAADNRGKHPELLASLRVVLAGLQAS
jgi:hypothetical protein